MKIIWTLIPHHPQQHEEFIMYTEVEGGERLQYYLKG